jgi:hypothetical protein
MRIAMCLSTVLALALAPARPALTSTADLIAAMQQQYGGSWYKTATFVQKTTNVAADGTMTDGRVVTTEEYSDLHADVTLDPNLFNPDYWTTVHWRR